MEKCQNAEEIKIESAPTKRPTHLPAVKDFPKTSHIKPKSARGTLNPGLLNLTKVSVRIFSNIQKETEFLTIERNIFVDVILQVCLSHDIL